METIYTLTGWVRKIIDNEHARTLEEIYIDAVGDLGKDTLVEIAKKQLEIWSNIYSNKKRKHKIAYTCTVYSNNVCDKNGIITRDQTIFAKLIKAEIKNTSNQ